MTAQVQEPKSAKATIVFDGECSFCLQQINRIRKMDSQDQFTYVPRQDSDWARYGFLNEKPQSGMLLILPEGKVYVGADAVYQIGRRLPQTRWIAGLYCVPGLKQIAQLVYAGIAANRKKLGVTCDEGKCQTKD